MSEKEVTYEDLLNENRALKRRLAEAENDSMPSSFSLLKLLMNSLPVLIAYIDPNFRFRLANKHYKVLHGVDTEEIIGKTIHEVIGDEGWAIEKPKYQKALEGEAVVSIDNFKTKIGVFHWYQVSLIPHIEHKEVKGIFCLVIDLTEQKLIENTIKENEQHLTQINATKDKFFSIISHDLRSPINSILGFSNLIERSIKKKEYENLEKYTSYIQQASQKNVDLLINLMEWSRSQTNQITFNPEFIELGALIKGTVELMIYSAQQKNIVISIEIIDVLTVFADKDMIKTILRNLISNAIKFTNKGGEIVISAEYKQEYCQISIFDNGVGIDERILNKLFKIEEKVSSVGTDNESGTGLGLILCNEFINKHGGEISVKSEAGLGSTFQVKLPINKK